MNSNKILELLPGIHLSGAQEIIDHSNFTEIPANKQILREGQYISHIPVVISGLIKVFTRYEDRELLLYYIQPNESCIMSFSAGLENEPSQIYAVAEEDTSVLLLPANKLVEWTRKFPGFNEIFFRQFNTRYQELLETINHLLFDRLDKRLMDHLKKKVELTGENPLHISHKQIANEIGTVREVVSRVMKKLEKEGKIRQAINEIEILRM